jgi:membrane protease YdiL (CAAX protease family)
VAWSKPARVKRFFQSEVGAAVAWVAGSLVLAAVVSPWLFRAGKHLAFTAEVSAMPAFLEWLGDACGRAKFGRYFNRAMLLSALFLLPVLLRRIRRLRSAAGLGATDSWSRLCWSSVAVQIVIGCVVAGGMLWGLGAILEVAGAYVPKPSPPSLGKLVSKVLIPAVAASLLEEWLFRGVLLGLWLRVARAAAAGIGSALLFAFLHFLEPPAGTVIADPGQAFAGFRLLGKILLHFTDPLFFVADFATLLAVGLILAWARVRTGSLWFSIGLHAGWIIVFKAFNLYYQTVPGHALYPWGVGESLRSGILPLVTLGITAAICHFALRSFSPARPPV